MAFAPRVSVFPKASAMDLPTRDRPAGPDGLGLALVLCSSTPLVLLDARFVVRAASGTFCKAFGLDPATVVGTTMFALGAGEWKLPQLRSLLEATLAGDAAIEAYEFDLKRGGSLQHLVVNVQRLDYANADEVRMVVAVADITAARAAERQKDDLVRDKQVLLQELQHRVANSLQIIASVLMQSARKVQSEEARTHLNDAHQRVLSIAMLQRQLAGTTQSTVALRTYFGDLCRTIGASMIGDPDRISIGATIDDTVASAEQSVSLGLIVTELIINALKHAFPDSAKSGHVAVSYQSQASGWTLTVSDNGVGRPANLVPGLGTGIVQALAKQLRASVEVRDAGPGTCVTIASKGAVKA